MTLLQLGRRQIPIADLNLGEDITSRVNDPHVVAMAETFEKVGCLQPPWVRQSTMEVVFGGDRTAAHLYLKRKKITVVFVEGTDEEMEEVGLVENGRRRHDIAEQKDALKRLVAKYEGEEKQKDIRPPDGPKPRGRTKSPKRRAVDRVAKETGRNPEALRQSLAEPKEPEECPIITFGIPMKPEFIAEMKTIIAETSRVRRDIVAAENAITRLVSSGTSIPTGPLGRIREELSRLIADLKLVEPYSICPYCKGHDPYQEECGGCLKAGWVSRETYDAADPGLKDDQILFVSYHGEMVPLVVEEGDVSAEEAF